MQDYFTELEAAQAASVSVETIREFAAIGLLKPEAKDGEKRYPRNNLELVFRSLKENEKPEPEQRPTEPTPAQNLNDTTQSLTAQIEVEKIIEQPEGHRTTTPKEVHSVIDNRSLEILELNRALREQIQALREERDWLRKRVETMEVRAERDQMLLLSESRTVQSLLPAPRKWRFRLPWKKS